MQKHEISLSQKEINVVAGGSIWSFIGSDREKAVNFFGSYGLPLAVATMAITSIKEVLPYILEYAIYSIGAGSIVYQIQKVYGAPAKTCEAGFLGAMSIFMYNQVIRVTHQK